MDRYKMFYDVLPSTTMISPFVSKLFMVLLIESEQLQSVDASNFNK